MSNRLRTRTSAALLATLAAVLSLAACGGSSGGSGHTSTGPSGPEVQRGKVQLSTEDCSSKSSAPSRGTCVITLSNGRRFQCPQDIAGKLQTAQAVTSAKECKKAPALKIPAAWKPAVKALDSVRDCLNGKGITASGGPLLGMPGRRADTPIGSLILPNTSVPTSIDFYASRAAANQAGPGAQSNVAASGGMTRQHGLAIISWSQQPDPDEQSTEVGCVSGG